MFSSIVDFSLNVKLCGVYLKISEPISLTGSAFVETSVDRSAGGIPPEPPFRPPRLEAEAKRTISSFSLPAAGR